MSSKQEAPQAKRKISPESDISEADLKITASKPVAPKKPRLTNKNAVSLSDLPSAASMRMLPKSPPPHKVNVGDEGFLKPFQNSGIQAMLSQKVLIVVREVKWDAGTKQWYILVENKTEVLPLGTTWWEIERALELPLKEDVEVLCYINKTWVEGVIERVHRDEEGGSWSYECSIIGTVKLASKDVKAAPAEHEFKVEKKLKKEQGGEGAGSGSGSFKNEKEE